MDSLPYENKLPAGNEKDPRIIHLDDESHLRTLFSQNEEIAFNMLFKKYYKVLCNHAVRFVYNKTVAEDITQDVFQVFWEKRAFQFVTVSYRQYLFQSVRNRAFNYLRLEYKLEGGEEYPTHLRSALTNPEQLMFFDELQHRIKNSIDKMPYKRKQVFILHRFDEKTYKEIANKLQISFRTVESHIRAAIKTLQTELKEYIKLNG